MSAMTTAFEKFERYCGLKLACGMPLEWLHWLESRALLRNVLQQLNINCVLDVGANQGQFGRALRGIGYKGWILSFEPVRESFRMLESVAKEHDSWRVFPYALGAVNDRLAINVAETTVLSSFLPPKEDSFKRFPDNRVERTETVQVRRLDDILEACLAGINSPRLYLKMDTQGFDLEVMKGGESALRKVLALQTEVSFKSIYEGMPSFMDSIQQFQARGFDVVAFMPVSSELDGPCAIEMDCIMARRLA